MRRRRLVVWLGSAVALCVLSPTAAAAPLFGPPVTLGKTDGGAGPPTLSVTEGGRIALAAGTENHRLYVVTRGTKGKFGPIRTVAIRGTFPQFLPLNPLVYLPLDESGRMVVMEYLRHTEGDNCCGWPAMVYLDAKARVVREQPLGPKHANTNGLLSWNARGEALFVGHTSLTARVMVGSPNGDFRSIPSPFEKLPSVGYVGPHAFAVVRDRTEGDLVATGPGDGSWSPHASLSAKTGDTLRMAFGPGGRSVAVWDNWDPLLDTARLEAAWLRDGKVTRRQTIATFAVPDFPQHAVAIDAAGRAFVVWLDGEGTVRTAEAGAGGKFGAPRLVWKAPAGQAVANLWVDDRPAGAIATWLAYWHRDTAGPPATVRAAGLRPGRAPGGAQVVATAPAHGGIYDPEVGLDAHGGGVVTWLEPIATGNPSDSYYFRWRAAVRSGSG